MNRGRRTLKRSVQEQVLTLEECESIAKIISLRRSNRIEIMDARREDSLALFPGKFRESLWIRRAVTQQKRKRKRIRIRIRGRDMCPIPLDLVIEILIRLPANSLVRSKCVSKQWSSLISCRHFFDRLFTVTRQQQPHLYMCLVDKDGKRILLSISSTSPDNTCLVVDQDLSISGMGGFFVNVIRGLMCFSVRKKARIYNPTTRQRLTLPAIKSDITAEQGQNKDTQYYIGHDPVNDQYKIFCTIAISSDWLANVKSEHWVFVLEAGGSWKKVVPLENYRPHFPDTVTQLINGSVVHYMAWLDMSTCAVLSFDIRSEELTTILVPQEAGDVGLPAVDMKAGLIEYAGKIALFDHTRLKDKGLVDLWIVDNAKRKGWSKKRLVVQPCQRHLVHDIDLIVKGTTQDDKVILAPAEMRSQFYILCYDMRSNDLRKVEIKGVPQLWFDKECYFDLTAMDESESVIYLET